MLNIIKNLLGGTISSLSEFNQIPLDHAFVHYSVNKDEYKNYLSNRIISIQNDKVNTLKLGLPLSKSSDEQSNHSTKSSLYINERESNYLKIEEVNQIFDRINRFICDESIRLIKSKQNEQSSVQVANENEGLEWLKVSLLVLKKSFSKIKQDPNLVFECRIYFGWQQKDSDPIFRLQCLSLDFLLEFLANGNLRVRVWNYKDGVKTSLDQEDLNVEFNGLKAPVFDEFITLLNEMRPFVLVNE